MKRKIKTPLVVALLWSAVVQTRAQSPNTDGTYPGLIELNTGYSFQTFVSVDSVKNYDHTLKNIKEAKMYFDLVFDTNLDLDVLFLDRNDWSRYAFFPPPGLPQAGQGKVILGLDKSVVSMQAEKMILRLPEQYLTQMKSVYGEELDMDLFYRQTLSLHELAHLYQFQHGTRPQRKWLQELFATMCMVAFVNNNCAPCFDLMDTYPQFVLQAGDQMAEYKTLSDFEEMYVQKLTPQNYEWFQMQFYAYAKNIMSQKSDSVLRRFLQFLAGTDLTNATLSDEELISRLKEDVDPLVANVLTNWKYQ